MPTFEIGVKKVEYGHAVVDADTPEQALQKFEFHDGVKICMYPGEDLLPLGAVQQLPDDET